VHFIAALRMAARAAGFGEVTVGAAASRGVAPDLPHPDTLLGTLWFESGARLGGGGGWVAVGLGQGRRYLHVVLFITGIVGWAAYVRRVACNAVCLSVCRRHRQLHNDLL
jgi:hypothetical protein